VDRWTRSRCSLAVAFRNCSFGNRERVTRWAGRTVAYSETINVRLLYAAECRLEYRPCTSRVSHFGKFMKLAIREAESSSVRHAQFSAFRKTYNVGRARCSIRESPYGRSWDSLIPRSAGAGALVESSNRNGRRELRTALPADSP
jgi:hypothetical protein